MMPMFFALAICVAFPKEWRIRPAVAILAAFILAIAPITIRNYIAFKTFIPLSVGFGTTFVEGLGDLDHDGSKGMPVTDEDVMRMDSAHFGRPDYYGNLYRPMGSSGRETGSTWGLRPSGQILCGI